MANKNFPGDSECYAGVVTGDDEATHVCLNCSGSGCKPKTLRRSARAARAERLRSLSGSTIFTDQKGRAVFVDLAKGTAFVHEVL